ncbi:4-hydroxythreonine-4-phosphate dehydrogenase protein [Apiospora rasikravindrae]|uniref:4-hydroxythreonine-4-phosphate dehydrogenase protein n=1 Tax=Apiospora rasikravindrae TaxID=990691 RepID=A0ABR1TC35_9PEZI
MEPQPQPRKPRIAVTLGDPSGIGPEVAAKLLSNPANVQRADIVVLADKSELDSAIADAGGAHIAISEGPAAAGPRGVQVLDDGTASDYHTTQGEVSKASGARSLHQLNRALHLAQAGEIDALVFAPLNKSSLKQAGMAEEDELRWLANQLQHPGRTSEINIILSTTATATAVPAPRAALDEPHVAARVTMAAVLETIELTHRLRWESGVARPRLGVCALNPHGGEGGAFGRHEIDHIAPAVGLARARGIDVQGPFPCDTIFLKRERFDAIVTMYHDQGQIAMKLLGFDGGVTVQGGLPIPVATPAHGTAFDIVGKNVASVTSMQNAFDVAVTMAERRLLKGIRGLGTDEEAAPLKSSAASPVAVAEASQ